MIFYELLGATIIKKLISSLLSYLLFLPPRLTNLIVEKKSLLYQIFLFIELK